MQGVSVSTYGDFDAGKFFDEVKDSVDCGEGELKERGEGDTVASGTEE